MAPARKPLAGQTALFGDQPIPKGRCAQHGKMMPHYGCDESERWLDARGFEPIPGWPDGIRPWDTINEADAQLGWEYRWLSPRRAVEIRQEIEHG